MTSSLTSTNKSKLTHIFKCLLLVFVLSTAQGLVSFSSAQATNFWHLNIGNYLNPSEAIRELQRLDTLGFKGRLVEVVENDTTYQQLRIGCYFDEATSSTYLNLIAQHLRYPSLSKIGKDLQASTSICLNYDIGIKLPNSWQILDDNNALVLNIMILDYERIIGFNGLEWQSFQSKDMIPQDWLNAVSDVSQLICQKHTTEKIDCEFEGEPLVTKLSGDIVWQKANTVVYKNDTHLSVLKVVSF